MKLNINFVPVIVTVLFLMGVVGMRDAAWSDFVYEYNAGRMLVATVGGTDVGSADSPLAFPNCKGWGCGALQNYRQYGLRVHYIKALGNGGNNTLDSALRVVYGDRANASKPLDQIVFDTAGSFIHSSGTMDSIRGLYIAGTTAPGEVTITNQPLVFGAGSEDIVIRGVRVRKTASGTSQLLVQMMGKRIVLDHVSMSHGAQRMFKFTSDTSLNYSIGDSLSTCTRYFTFSNGLVAFKPDSVDGSSNPPTTFINDGFPKDESCTTHGLTYRTLFVNSGYRNPVISAESVWVHQNVVYNWFGNKVAAFGSDEFLFDYTYNYAKRGPRTDASGSYGFGVDWEDTATVAPCDNDDPDGADDICDKSVYVSKNRMPQAPAVADTAMEQDSIWFGPRRYVGTYAKPTLTPNIGARRTSPLYFSGPFGWDTLTLSDANVQQIADSAGAWFVVDSLGALRLVRDSTDRRAIDAFTDSVSNTVTGDRDRDDFVIPPYEFITLKCRNEDGDAMCDAWEAAVHGDTSLANDSLTVSGYFAAELYAAGINDLDWLGDVPGGAEGPTYADARLAYLIYAVEESVITRDEAGAVVDTFVRKGPHPDSIDAGSRFRAILVSGRDSAIILTYDTLSYGALQDSAAVDSILAVWGITGPPFPWSVSVPGEP